MARALVINSQLQIPASELSLSFARSAGPGGQNVNKVNTKAILRWNFDQTQSLPEEITIRFRQKYSQRINNVGEVVLSSDRHRNQLQNINDCYEKLRQLILAATIVPRARKKSRPTRGAIEQRLKSKRHSAERKKRRRFRPGADD